MDGIFQKDERREPVWQSTFLGDYFEIISSLSKHNCWPNL